MLEEKIIKIAKDSKKAARLLGNLTTELKNKAIINMAAALIVNIDILIKANGQDLEEGKKNNLSAALIDRLTLDAKRIEAMAKGLREIASLPDPVGEVTKMWRRPNGLQIGKIRTPIGVIGAIYESRPN
ncbi:MAG: gamma-glutamyl-phosphate reductase, partial [Nitrospinae bacterium]|nr:gamma-glutamyl-phosphate reductase [Nitrospinota bacterium]